MSIIHATAHCAVGSSGIIISQCNCTWKLLGFGETHGPSPILHVTLPLFVYIDQLLIMPLYFRLL